MKRILFIIVFSIVVMGRLAAQEVTYWVGQSSNPDPIMRHHEAFMDAFVKYIHGHSIDAAGEVVVNSDKGHGSSDKRLEQNFSNETCRVETVASVTHDGCETLTISIGSGPLVVYEYMASNLSSESGYEKLTDLRITCKNELNGAVAESTHNYMYSSRKNNSEIIDQFKYLCVFNHEHE